MKKIENKILDMIINLNVVLSLTAQKHKSVC